MTISKHTLQNRIYITMTNECLNLFSSLLGFGHGIMGRRFPEMGVAEIQKMSPLTTGRCK